MKEVYELKSLGWTKKKIAQHIGFSAQKVTNLLDSMIRVLCIGDLHCGHVSGLTPPEYQTNDAQAEIWDWFSAKVKLLNPDILIVNGDSIDGKGKRSGGSELITGSWMKQADMAIEVIAEVNTPRVHLTYGTPYHTGDDEDYEWLIAKQFGGSIHGHLFLDVNGVIFDVKHKVGSGSVPHTRTTAIKREQLWNVMWAERKQQPKSDILLRSHVHYHEYAGKHGSLAMTLPALQGWGSKFGVRQCSGLVDTGLVWFDVRKDDTVNTIEWHSDIPDFECHKVDIIR